MSRCPCVVILAAGQGSRYRQEAGSDQDKLSALCRGLDGVDRSVLEQVLINLPSTMERRVLVTTPERAEIARLAEAYGCQVVRLASSGMGGSLAAAVRASADASGWIIVLGDMPFIQPATIAQVAEALASSSVSVACMDGRYGHPVAFSRAHFQGLSALSGDRGARGLWEDGQVATVEVIDPGIFWDIDVPSALVGPESPRS